MHLGLIGLGKMGGNMRERLRRAGHTVTGFDHNPRTARRRRPRRRWSAGLSSPRVVWVMVPAGDPTHETIDSLGELLDKGDVVVDGGNSRWTDDQLHAGTSPSVRSVSSTAACSGGVWGLENGYALMSGGSAERHRHLPADLRRPQAGQRVRLRARRTGRCRPLRQDGAQRHRVRAHAGLCRGLRAAGEGRGRRERARGAALVARGHRHPVVAARPAGRGARRGPGPVRHRRLGRGLRRGAVDRRGGDRPRGAA